MAFLPLPTELQWPYQMFNGLITLATIRSGALVPFYGPAALIVADRWVRVHAQRTPASSGTREQLNWSSYVHILSLVGYFSPESEGFEFLWDIAAASGSTFMRMSVTYQTSGLTDVWIGSGGSPVRDIYRVTGLTLPNYIPGPFIAKIEVGNSSSNGYHYGLTLVEIPLTSI